jgi:DNA-binding transcriptional ArsR family regulator
MPPAVRRNSSPTDTVEFDPDQMQAHLAEAAHLLKALGNEQRLHILCNLLEGPLSVGELNQRLELSQSALSQHLALLRESGLVDTRREAQTIYYSLPDGPVIRVMALLQDVYCSADPALRSRDEAGPNRALCED